MTDKTFNSKSGVVFCVSSLCLGCGPSQEELMMRAARRPRGDTAQSPRPPDLTATKVTARVNTTEAKLSPVVQSGLSSVESVAGHEPKLSVAPAEQVSTSGVEPITMRRPENPLTTEQARERSLNNLETIRTALLECVAKTGQTPTPHRFNSGRFKTLSWRVELLPYLGHQTLYEQFDPEVPWNQEPNKSRLQYIPEAYVSPERFDTNTNYLLPAGFEFLFDRNFPMLAEDDQNTDGKANTLMLLEVNDSLAVPWTSPADYEPANRAALKSDLGGVRGDGAFAVWGNGYPVLLRNSLSNQQLLNALSFHSGDGQAAASIHRDITLSVKPAADAMPKEIASVERQPLLTNISPIASTSVARRGIRLPLPNASDVATSRTLFAKSFATKIQKAESHQERLGLARELLKMSSAMPDDPAGAFTLQSAAMRLATEVGGIKELLDAIDQRLAIFAVDSYEENATQLVAYGKANVSRTASFEVGSVYLRRVIPLVFTGLERDDYPQLLSLVSYAERFSASDPNASMTKDLNRLRVALSQSQRQYEQLADALAKFRVDPEDPELALLVGRYMCFIKGDWEVGLPLLAKCQHERLREVARLDLADVETASDQIAVADSWWALAESASSGVYKQSSIERAVDWYSRAQVMMPASLERLYVQSRIETAGEIVPTGPLPLARRLAQELGIDEAEAMQETIGQVTNPK